VLIDKHAQIKTPGKLNKLVEFASFSDTDLILLADEDVQQALISFLISQHFSDVRQEIERL
jgi:predicted restriction endonuclease